MAADDHGAGNGKQGVIEAADRITSDARQIAITTSMSNRKACGCFPKTPVPPASTNRTTGLTGSVVNGSPGRMAVELEVEAEATEDERR